MTHERRRTRIVHVIPRTLTAPEDGGALRTAALASALARVGELHIVSLDPGRPAGQAGERRAAGERCAVGALPLGGEASFHDLRFASARVRWLRSLALRLRAAPAVPLRWGPRSPREVLTRATIEALAPDVVIADDTFCAPLAVFSSAAVRVVSTHNLESALWREHARRWPNERSARRHARTAADVERDLLARADQVWGVRASDLRAYAAAGVRSDRLHLVPNVIPRDRFEPAPAPGEPWTAVYFGSLWYWPAAEAALEAARVCARLRSRGHPARLLVAGRGIPDGLRRALLGCAGVELLGFVEDLPALLRRAAAVLIPLQAGGGTKLKVLEAMAAAKPVVLTPVAAEGLALEDGRHAIVREVGPSLDAAAATVLADPAAFQAMGRAAQALASERYSDAALLRSVSDALRPAAEAIALRPGPRAARASAPATRSDTRSSA